MASSSDVVILDISAGWNLTGPNSNQEWDPFTSFDTNITTTRSPSTNRYIGSDALSQNWGFITNRITAASTKDVSIQTNCFPQRKLKSNMLAGPSEWMEAYMFTQPMMIRSR